MHKRPTVRMHRISSLTGSSRNQLSSSGLFSTAWSRCGVANASRRRVKVTRAYIGGFTLLPRLLQAVKSWGVKQEWESFSQTESCLSQPRLSLRHQSLYDLQGRWRNTSPTLSRKPKRCYCSGLIRFPVHVGESRWRFSSSKLFASLVVPGWASRRTKRSWQIGRLEAGSEEAGSEPNTQLSPGFCVSPSQHPTASIWRKMQGQAFRRTRLQDCITRQPNASGLKRSKPSRSCVNDGDITYHISHLAMQKPKAPIDPNHSSTWRFSHWLPPTGTLSCRSRLLHGLLVIAHNDASFAHKLQEAMCADILKALASTSSRRDPRVVLRSNKNMYE